MSQPDDNDNKNVSLEAVDSIMLGFALYEGSEVDDAGEHFDSLTSNIPEDELDFQVDFAYQNVISYLLSTISKYSGKSDKELIADMRLDLLSKV